MASSGDSIPQRFVLVRIRDLDEFKNTFTKAHKDSALYFHPEIVGEYKSKEDDGITKLRAQKTGQGVSIIGTSKLSASNTHAEITNWIAEKDKQHEKTFQFWFENLRCGQVQKLERHCLAQCEYSKQCFEIMKENLHQQPKAFERLFCKYKEETKKKFEIRLDERKKELQTEFEKWLCTQYQAFNIFFHAQECKEEASFTDWLEIQYQYGLKEPFKKMVEWKKEPQDPEPHIKELFQQLKLREEQSKV